MWRDGHNGKASAVIGWRSCPLGGTLIQHRHEPIRSDRLRVARGKLRGRGLRHELPQSFRRDLVEFMKGRERPDAPRILSILNDDQSFFHVNQWPLGFADLFLAQCRCHGISDDPSHRYELSTVRLKVFDEFVEFVLCGPSVTLFAFSNQIEVT
jgi:hypothetical protein